MKEKNINIDINIENNLMSKNKIPHNDDNISSKNAPTAQHKYVYNPELPREVNEYYGIMASKRFYQNTASQQPLNLHQYIGQPAQQPAPVSPTNVPSWHSSPEPEPDIAAETFAQLQEPVSGNPISANPEQNGFRMFSRAEEDEYQKSLSNVGSEKGNRKKMIEYIKNTDTSKPFRMKKSTILNWNLAYLVSKHRPDEWNRILSGDYPY